MKLRANDNHFINISVIVPVYNEAETIKEAIRRVRQARPEAEIIVVDDNSTDGSEGTLRVLEKREKLILIRHMKNLGKGACIRSALPYVTGDVVIIQDADLEYDPSDYPKLLEPIFDGRTDVVYGSRFLGGPLSTIYFWHYVGNKFLTIISNILNNLNLTDMETGYKAFKKAAMEGVKVKEDRFGFEPEITAKFARKGLRICEVPISYSGRTFMEGKKIKWWDGIMALWYIVKYRFSD